MVVGVALQEEGKEQMQNARFVDQTFSRAAFVAPSLSEWNSMA